MLIENLPIWLADANQCEIILNAGDFMTLRTAPVGQETVIQRIETNDHELDAFLFSLGCYTGEPITVISRRRGSCIVSIKDGRYTMDNQLAEAITVA